MRLRHILLCVALGTGVVFNSANWLFDQPIADAPPNLTLPTPPAEVATAAVPRRAPMAFPSYKPELFGSVVPVAAVGDSPSPSIHRPTARLIGLITEGGSSVAVLEIVPDQIDRLRQGDAVSGWTVREISRSGVVLQGLKGELRLSLDPLSSTIR